MAPPEAPNVSSGSATLSVLDIEERAGFAPVLDGWLRPGAAVSSADELPLLLGPNARSIRVVARVDGSPVSHAALYRWRYRLTPEWSLDIGIIGAVATDPEHRRQGHAERCVRALQRIAHRNELDAVVLWDQNDGPYYRRFGFVRSGRERLHLVTRARLSGLAPRSSVVPMTRAHLPAIAAWHQREPCATERSRNAWRQLLDIPRLDGYVLQRNDEVVAYGFVGKGIDMGGCVHEWGGIEVGLPALLSGIFDYRNEDELAVMSPFWKHQASLALSFHGVRHLDGVLGMIWAPHPVRLAIKSRRPELIGLSHDELIVDLLQGPSPLPFYLRGLDSM